MDQNRGNIEKVKVQIEETFQNFIKKITEQKVLLFNQLDEIEKDNNEFDNFERDILVLKDKFQAFQEEIKMEGKQLTVNEFEEFNNCREKVQKIGFDYSGLKKKPFKIIGEYEKPKPDEIDCNFFGNLIIAESELHKPQPKENGNKNNNNNNKSKVNSAGSQSNSSDSKVTNEIMLNSKDETTESNSNDKIPMFGTLRVKLKRLAEQMNELQSTAKAPVVEFDINITPKFITNYNRHIFIADENGNLVTAELGNTLMIKSSIKLSISSIKGIAANKKYLALSYFGLTNEQMSNIRSSIKKFDTKSGVLFFKLNDSYSNISFDKIISSNKSHSLMTPCGLCLNDTHLFVCDRELHAVFKIEIKTGNFVQKLITTDQEPISISIGEKYFVYTDGLKLELNLVDMEKFSILKTVKFSDELFYEPFDVTYKESKDNGFVFVKNKADTKLIVYDSNLNIKYSFDYDFSNSQAICFLKLKEDFLLLGYANMITNNFKLGLFNDL